MDEDGDGRGEYGGLREMAAHVRPRGRTDVVGVARRVAVLLREFGEQVADGSLHDAGYRFRVFLASRSGGAVAETNTGFADGVVDPDLAEVRFVAYAWPDVRRKGAERTFVVTESGDVYATDAAAYEGAAGPAAGAAMSSGTIDSIRGGIASGRRALDGNVWTRLP